MDVTSETFGIILLTMLSASYAAERTLRLNPRYVAAIVGAVLLLLAVSKTHLVLADIGSLVRLRGRELFSPAGIQAFCFDLTKLADAKFTQVLILLVTVYLTLQTFCIPGTVALNAAIGALIGTAAGVPLCVALGTVGASLCYTLSSAVGTKLVEAVDLKLMKGKGVPKLRAQVQKYRSELLVYMLFLRLTPVLPNWLVNLASPIVHVPLKVFAVATCFGIIPQTYLSVRFGAFVAQQRNHPTVAADSHVVSQQVVSIVTTADTLFLCGVAVLIVVLARLKRRFAPSTSVTGSTHEDHRVAVD